MSVEAMPQTEQELADVWPGLSDEERVEAFRTLPRGAAGEFFLGRSGRTQALLVRHSPPFERRILLRMLAPDDAADVLQEVDPEERAGFLDLLDERTKRDVRALLAYREDVAGGLMSPRFLRLRPDMTVDEAIAYARRQSGGGMETIYYLYVLDAGQHLQGVVTFRELFAAPGDRLIRDVMETDVLTISADLDQEEAARVVAEHDLLAVPVVDHDNRMVGIVTVDDIVDVVEQEATEDIQKVGGTAALDRPYLQTSVWAMVRKRAGWLGLLFVGEMFTASAMGLFEAEIAAAVVLAVFLPLIISSGGNSGSQASTLVIRAMALGEVKPRDWWRVVRRELGTGFLLGLILAILGVVRIFAWQGAFGSYGEHAGLLSIAVGVSVMAVVTWGTLAGSSLPFALRRFGLDPASASAPFVATLVDVTGVLIYFSVARVVLAGSLL